MITTNGEGAKGRGRRLAGIAATAAVAALLAVSTGETASDECHPRAARDVKHPDCGIHNMMVVGQQAIYASHLPMFDSEHRFQVILEVELGKRGQSLSKAYFDDRRANPTVRMYTLEPRETFVLARLFGADPPPTKAFRGNVYRGHLERRGVQLDRLTDVDVTVKRVLYAQEIGPAMARPDTLDYILFGSGTELFLAHRITQPPDFDQIVGVKVSGRTFTSDELIRGVSIKVPDRPNAPDRRLRAKDKVAGQGQVKGSDTLSPLTLEVTTEFYFEESELASPGELKTTPLEKAAGF